MIAGAMKIMLDYYYCNKGAIEIIYELIITRS